MTLLYIGCTIILQNLYIMINTVDLAMHVVWHYWTFYLVRFLVTLLLWCMWFALNESGHICIVKFRIICTYVAGCIDIQWAKSLTNNGLRFRMSVWQEYVNTIASWHKFSNYVWSYNHKGMHTLCQSVIGRIYNYLARTQTELHTEQCHYI